MQTPLMFTQTSIFERDIQGNILKDPTGAPILNQIWMRFFGQLADNINNQSTITITTTAPLQGGGDLSQNRTFSITKATGSVDGYLDHTDYTTISNAIAKIGKSLVAADDAAVGYLADKLAHDGTIAITETDIGGGVKVLTLSAVAGNITATAPLAVSAARQALGGAVDFSMPKAVPSTTSGYIDKDDLAVLAGKASASGTTGTHSKFTGAAALGDSNTVEDSSGNQGIGVAASSAAKVNVAGKIRASKDSSNYIEVYAEASDGYGIVNGQTGLAIKAGGTTRIYIDSTTGHIGINKNPNARTFLTINTADLPQGNAVVPLGLDSNALQSGDCFLDTQAIVTGAYTIRVKS
jgi:hypothetical protein